jgi:type II secretory pathway pseudopilin PulG
MNPTLKQARKKRAFTIVELLTVMSIIVVLIGLLVPALNKARRYALYVKQKAQLRSMDAAIELFNNELGGYPNSGALDSDGMAYCGAMKLCEALMGQDLLGMHANSLFRRNGLDATNIMLYPANIDTLATPIRSANLTARKGPYLQAENANAWRMQDIYGTSIGQFLPGSRVLCDVYERQMASGEKTGMPILYYKADTANSFHDPNRVSLMTRPDNGGNIYSYYDNLDLINLGKPWQQGGSSSTPHRLADPIRFYRNTQSDKITTATRPFRPEEYILISAGWDNEYGTADDIYNFDWRYRE